MLRRKPGRAARVEHVERDEHDRQEDGVDVSRGRLEVGDRVSEGDAERRQADDAGEHEHDQGQPFARPADSEDDPAGEDHDRDLQRAVGDGVRGDAAEVGQRRQRRAADPLQHAAFAQEHDVVGERRERRRHHAHRGDRRQQLVEVALAAAEDRPAGCQEQQRQHEVEERRARVAPEHLALQAVLAPAERDGAGTRRPPLRHRPSAPCRRPRASGGRPTARAGASPRPAPARSARAASRWGRRCRARRARPRRRGS